MRVAWGQLANAWSQKLRSPPFKLSTPSPRKPHKRVLGPSFSETRQQDFLDQCDMDVLRRRLDGMRGEAFEKLRRPNVRTCSVTKAKRPPTSLGIATTPISGAPSEQARGISSRGCQSREILRAISFRYCRALCARQA